MALQSITPRAFFELRQAGCEPVLIDVRTPAEFQEVHAVGAKNIPLDALGESASSAFCCDSETVYFICKSGGRGRQACERMAEVGVLNVVNIEGGTTAWEAAGLPVLRGERNVISLERQVRIAAGGFVLLGTALGVFVHSAFLGISAFVGAGLIFAGVTDTCGMGLMLSRCPWNRVSPGKAGHCSR